MSLLREGILFVNSIYCYSEHCVFSAQISVVPLRIREGDIDFYSISGVCPDELFFKIIDV